MSFEEGGNCTHSFIKNKKDIGNRSFLWGKILYLHVSLVKFQVHNPLTIKFSLIDWDGGVACNLSCTGGRDGKIMIRGQTRQKCENLYGKYLKAKKD
jgi:hypothetical protein